MSDEKKLAKVALKLGVDIQYVRALFNAKALGVNSVEYKNAKRLLKQQVNFQDSEFEKKLNDAFGW